jgi:hypothetical protein
MSTVEITVLTRDAADTRRRHAVELAHELNVPVMICGRERRAARRSSVAGTGGQML